MTEFYLPETFSSRPTPLLVQLDRVEYTAGSIAGKLEIDSRIIHNHEYDHVINFNYIHVHAVKFNDIHRH